MYFWRDRRYRYLWHDIVDRTSGDQVDFQPDLHGFDWQRLAADHSTEVPDELEEEPEFDDREIGQLVFDFVAELESESEVDASERQTFVRSLTEFLKDDLRRGIFYRLYQLHEKQNLSARFVHEMLCIWLGFGLTLSSAQAESNQSGRVVLNPAANAGYLVDQNTHEGYREQFNYFTFSPAQLRSGELVKRILGKNAPEGLKLSTLKDLAEATEWFQRGTYHEWVTELLKFNVRLQRADDRFSYDDLHRLLIGEEFEADENITVAIPLYLNHERLKPLEQIEYQYYTVQSGDNPTKIAQKHNVSLGLLHSIQDKSVAGVTRPGRMADLDNPRFIQPGEVVIVPKSSGLNDIRGVKITTLMPSDTLPEMSMKDSGTVDGFQPPRGLETRDRRDRFGVEFDAHFGAFEEECTYRYENGVVICRQGSGMYYRVQSGDTLPSIQQKLSQADPGRFGYLAADGLESKRDVTEININPADLKADTWLQIPLPPEMRKLTPEEFIGYARKAVESMKTHKRYGSIIGGLERQMGRDNLLAMLYAIGMQESGLGKYSLYRVEPGGTMTSYGYMHVLLTGPKWVTGDDAAACLGMDPGDTLDPESSIKLCLADLVEKALGCINTDLMGQKDTPVPSEKTVLGKLASKYGLGREIDFRQFAEGYNGADYSKNRYDTKIEGHYDAIRSRLGS